MGDRLKDLWKRLVRIGETRGLEDPEFGQALQEFGLERERRFVNENVEPLGSRSNGFKPEHSERGFFGAREPRPDDHEV